MSAIEVISANELVFEGRRFTCAIGEKGFTGTPHEGGRQTPTGTYALRECWYRADRIAPPVTKLPLRIIRKSDGWCDAPQSPEYNRHVELPFAASHENLWREDHTYDIIVPIGFNDTDIVPGKGSAIFFHIAKPGYTPTLGCVAVVLPDMLEILAKVDKETKIAIRDNSGQP